MLTRRLLDVGVDPGVRQAPPLLRALPLRRSFLERARRIADADPEVNVHVAALLGSRPAHQRALRGIWVVEEQGEPVAVVQHRRGISCAVDPRRARVTEIAGPLARIVIRELRGSEVLFGEESLVRAVVRRGGAHGVHIAEFRSQELLAAPEASRPPGPPPIEGFGLRLSTRADLPWLLDAHASMCREDLGVDQVSRNRAGYREYFSSLIASGQSIVGEIAGLPVFKAEHAVESGRARLVEGVWTSHDVRRRGLAEWSMRVLANDARRSGRSACLYVHRGNDRARRVYRRAGFRPVRPWATALVTDDARGARDPGSF